VKRGHDDEQTKTSVGVGGKIGPPMELGQFALLAKRGDRFLDPSGNVQVFDAIHDEWGVRVFEEDRIHKRVRRGKNGAPIKDHQGRAIVDVRVTPAVWSSRVIVRPVPRDYQSRIRLDVCEVRSVACEGGEV
jgi:hypothetical protein